MVGADPGVYRGRVLEGAELAEARNTDDAVRANGFRENSLQRAAAVTLRTTAQRAKFSGG